MSPEALVGELERDPFIPLRIYRSDGRNIEILNPGLCFILGLTLYVYRPGRVHAALAEEVNVVSLRNITSVETFQPSERA